MKHVSGEPADFGPDYDYYDENCDEQTLFVRINNTETSRANMATNSSITS